MKITKISMQRKQNVATVMNHIIPMAACDRVKLNNSFLQIHLFASKG